MNPKHIIALAAISLPPSSLACGGGRAPSNDNLRIAVAPLDLPGLGVACYDIAVTTPSQTVWSKGNPLLTRLGDVQTDPPDPLFVSTTPRDSDTVCSDQYGNLAGGDIAYVGPCDASLDADSDGNPANGVQNTVTLWVDGLYNAGKTAEIGSWRDPCPNGCALQIDCSENEDSLAEFNLTIMREANQGFFDVAVDFDDIFCSAKFDTCYPNETATVADDEPIKLLFGDDQERDWTGVFGFACSAGSNRDTTLAYGEITVTCAGGISFTIDPGLSEGSNHNASSGSHTLHYGIYRGNEQLDCDDATTPGVVESCRKLYWNLAFDLADLVTLGECTLTLSATAYDEAAGFVAGVPSAPGVSYPYIEVDTQLTSEGTILCQRNGLDDGGGVSTAYRGTLGGLPPATPMCSAFDGVDATDSCGAICECPAGYELDASGTQCINFDTVPATVNTSQWEVCPGDTNGAYSKWGARFHSSFTPGALNEGGWTTGACADPATCVAETGLPWWDAGAVHGYLSDVGVWACAPGTSVSGSDPVGSWIGFSHCLELAHSGDYLIGTAGDNHVMFRVDGVEVYRSVNSLNFYSWNVFRLHLEAGTHIIELFGMNDGNDAAFGAEIAGPFPVGSIDTPTAMAAADYQGNIVFSTRDLRGGGFTFDTSLGGAASGTTCPDGYALDLCDETPVCRGQTVVACLADAPTCPCYDQADLEALAATTTLNHFHGEVDAGVVVDVLVNGDSTSGAGTVVAAGQAYCIYSVGQGAGADQLQPMDGALVETCNALIDAYAAVLAPPCSACTGLLGTGTAFDPFHVDAPPTSCAGYATMWPGVQPPDGNYLIDIGGGAPYRLVFCELTHGWEIHRKAVNLDLAGTRAFCSERGLQLAAPTAAEATELAAVVTANNPSHLRMDLDVSLSGGCDSTLYARSNVGAYRTVSPYPLQPGISQCASTSTEYIVGAQLAAWYGYGYYSAVGTGNNGGLDHSSWTQVCVEADATQCLSFDAPEAGPFPVCTWCATGAAAAGAWPLDEGSGATAGNVGTGTALDGDIVGATWDTDTPTCESSHALTFNGVDQYVELGAPVALTQLVSFTIALWFKTSDADRDFPTLFSYWYSGGTADAASYSLSFSAGSGLVFMLQDGAGHGVGATAGFGYGDGAWHHVVASYDHATRRAAIYVDGGLKNSYANPAFLGPDPDIPHTVRIGADDRWAPGDPSALGYFAGSIDEVRFYDRALAPCEVGDLHAVALDPHCP